MNYLGHYAYNHTILRVEPSPYFVLGVALPDLWSRFSRKRRLRWKAVCAAEPVDPRIALLRAGLLNHIDADRIFHALPIFEQWRRELKQSVVDHEIGGLLKDFLSHLIPELMLDHKIMKARPELAESFYDWIAACDSGFVEAEISGLGAVNAEGLAREIDDFVRRRFLPRFQRVETIAQVVEFVLSLTPIVERPPQDLVARMVRLARRAIRPDDVWAQMAGLSGATSASDRAGKSSMVRDADSPIP